MGTTAGEQGRPLIRCRICAGALPAAAAASQGPDLAAACIFGEEGRRRSLQSRIHKYLHIAVSSEDRLTKMVCCSCIAKLDGVHSFATMALESQEKLRQELLKTNVPAVVTPSVKAGGDEAVMSCAKQNEPHGLLHSILTKGSSNEVPNDEDLMQTNQRNGGTVEMEVKIDPMLYLQCTLDHPSSEENSDLSDDSDRDPTNHHHNGFLEHRKRLRKLQKSCDDNDNENLESIENDGNEMSGDDDDDDYEEEAYDPSAITTKNHICQVCSKAFGSQLALQNHLWSHLPSPPIDPDSPIDNGAAVLRAHETNNVASQADNLSDVNFLDGSFICPICGKNISTKGNLKVHLETHRPKGKHGCDICGRIFKTQSNLFRHKEYHAGVQFACSVCGRVYPTNSTLRAHSITHSDLRPHACPLCDKTFKRNQDLKFHINQHTGARPYQCPYCPKAFASSGNCFSHRKRMHPKEVHRDRQRAADLMR